jgi:hypothetical protein
VPRAKDEIVLVLRRSELRDGRWRSLLLSLPQCVQQRLNARARTNVRPPRRTAYE